MCDNSRREVGFLFYPGQAESVAGRVGCETKQMGLREEFNAAILPTARSLGSVPESGTAQPLPPAWAAAADSLVRPEITGTLLSHAADRKTPPESQQRCRAALILSPGSFRHPGRKGTLLRKGTLQKSTLLSRAFRGGCVLGRAGCRTTPPKQRRIRRAFICKVTLVRLLDPALACPALTDAVPSISAFRKLAPRRFCVTLSTAPIPHCALFS